MIYTSEIVWLEEAVDELVTTILTTSTGLTYKKQQEILAADLPAQSLKNNFLKEKEKFAEWEQYGKLAPGYREKMLALRKMKRQLDVLPNVAAFRKAETDLQEELDEVALKVSHLISTEIKVDYGNPFFHQGKSGQHSCQGGGCHHG